LSKRRWVARFADGYRADICRLAHNVEDLVRIVRSNEKGISVQFNHEHLTFNGDDSSVANLLLTMLEGRGAVRALAGTT
jgi:hypothetical protein